MAGFVHVPWYATGLRHDALAAALADISPGDRDVLLLVAWAELTSEEAGQALGIPAGTARSRLHRARRQLRTALTNTISGKASHT